VTGSSGTPAGVVSASPAPVSSEHPYRVAGIVTSVVGGALLGTGIAFGAIAHSDANAVSQQYDPSKADAGKTAQIIGIVGSAVGAAAIAAGLYLVVHERSGPPAMVSLGASPGADPHSGLLLLGATF
jgi:hypothetical protein